jgi:hypothetical protein
MEMCIDSFPDKDIKKMSETVEFGKELSNNALAIIDKALSFLVVLHIQASAVISEVTWQWY